MKKKETKLLEGVRQLVHTPAELAAEHVAWAEGIQADPGIKFGVPEIDRRVIPMRPGTLTCLIGRPGHAKTSMLCHFARVEAERIRKRGNDNECVIYVTWEQAAEELAAFFQTNEQYSVTDIMWGRVDLPDLKRKAVEQVNTPIWVIGHSIARSGQKMPRMTTEMVMEAIRTIRSDFGYKPTLLLFDYLQIIPVPHARDRVQQVSEIPVLVKELALQIGAAAIAGAQASREVDKREVKIPEMSDAMWAAAIEHTADKVFGLWRPWQTEDPSTTITLHDGRVYPVTETLLVIRLLKQRFDKGRYTWAMYFDPAYLKLTVMATDENGDEREEDWWQK